MISARSLAPIFLDKVRRARRAETKIGFFLGAGADISSGGVSFNELKLRCMRRFSGTNRHLPVLPASEIDAEFNSWLQEITSEADKAALIDYVIDEMGEIEPSEGYLLMALLAQQGAIDAIITTNFDNLLEKSERRLGRSIFQVYAPGVAQPYVSGATIQLPLKPIYIKLHGDLDARVVTHVTKEEIAARRYSPVIIKLVRQILETHQMFFIGYGGYDGLLAEAVGAVKRQHPKVYWISPSRPKADAPFVGKLGAASIDHLSLSFDAFLQQVSRETLAEIDPLRNSPVFLKSLLADRISAANVRYQAAVLGNTKETARTLIRRVAVDGQLLAFRKNERLPLAVLSGPSGCGKSTTIAMILDDVSEAPFPPILVIPAGSIRNDDLAGSIIREIESGFGDSLQRLFQFSSWLKEQGLQLMVVVEDLNDYSPRLDEIVRLFRGVLEVASHIRIHGSIKLLVTLRRETWNEVFPRLDRTTLKRVLWESTGHNDQPNAIAVTEFDDAEARLAFDQLSGGPITGTAFDRLPDNTRRLLRDPFSMRCAVAQEIPLQSTILKGSFVKLLLQGRLGHGISAVKLEMLEHSLVQVAEGCFLQRTTWFDTASLASAALDENDVRALLDGSILTRIDAATLAFGHDRILEYFLALSIRRGRAMKLTDVRSVERSLALAREYSHLRSAMAQCFVEPERPNERAFGELLLNLLRHVHGPIASADELTSHLRLFVSDVLVELARQNPSLFQDLLGTLDYRQFEPLVARRLSSAIMQAATYATNDVAFPLWLSRVANDPSDDAAATEVLLYDRFVRQARKNGFVRFPYEDTRIFQNYFFNPNAPRIVGLFRLLRLVANVEEFDAITGPEALTPLASFCRLLKQWAASTGGDSTSKLIATAIPARRYNEFFFNAAAGWIDRFYMSESRKSLRTSFDRVTRRGTVSAEDLACIFAAASDLDQPASFSAANLIVALSFRNDHRGTMDVLGAALRDRAVVSRPEMVDFMLSALFVGKRLTHNGPFPEIDRFTRDLLREVPDVFLLTPGSHRTRSRNGFLDEFDCQFEDGFNPFAFYFYDAVHHARAATSARESARSYVVPLYREQLAAYESNGCSQGVVRVIHALGQMISLWPDEGLAALMPLIGRQDPTVRRAVERVLAESFIRFPAETDSAMAASGAAFDHATLYHIRCELDSRLANRTFEQVHWCRVVAFLEHLAPSQQITEAIAGALINSTSWPEAFHEIAGVLEAAVDSLVKLPPIAVVPAT
ncbi:hypothetical protein GALL_311610 [mine drainage metagenome]|uniref:Uncharacterized protein n=1 Tax=mine drainage metagenome TaxID=410659 RepID=A0A1J5R4K6_9ZZZZ